LEMRPSTNQVELYETQNPGLGPGLQIQSGKLFGVDVSP
jgi:hypothetical protein